MKKLIWIDHDSEIDYGKEECFEYISIENDKTSLSKLDRLLSDIKSNAGIEVYKIKAKTRDFVKLNLFFKFLNFLIPESKGISEG